MNKITIVFVIICISFAVRLGAYDVICVAAPSVDLNVHLSEEHAKIGYGGSLVTEKESIDALLEKVPQEAVTVSAGGSGANTVRALGHLGNHCAMIGHIGTDKMKDVFLEALEKAHVTPILTYSNAPTQQVLCIITPDKQRTFRCCLGAVKEFNPSHLPANEFKNTRLVHVEGYLIYNPGVVEATLEFAKKAGALVSMDVGCYQIAKNHKEQFLNDFSKSIDILFTNSDEALALTDLPPMEACAYLQTKFPYSVVLIGAEGCLVGHHGTVTHVPTEEVTVVDTVGAGDYFAAGFLHGFLRGLAPERCAVIGNRMGGSIVQVGGSSLSEERWHDLLSSTSSVVAEELAVF